MSTQRLNNDNDIPLLHAGLLAYLRLSTSSPNTPLHSETETAPPPYSIPYPTPRLSKPIDEERSCGFWSSSATTTSDDDDDNDPISGLRSVKCDQQGFYAFCCFWGAVSVCILGALGVFFTLDIVFSTFGMGTGVGRWIVGMQAASTNYDMHFCLASPNRAAPGPQTWRYISAANIPECSTEVITLTAESSEFWKLWLDDEATFGNDAMVGDDLLHRTRYERSRRELTVEEKIGMLDLGDDLATEGEDGLLGLLGECEKKF